MTKKSLPASPAANRTSPGSTARRRPSSRNRARWSSLSRGNAPSRSTVSGTPAPISAFTGSALVSIFENSVATLGERDLAEIDRDDQGLGEGLAVGGTQEDPVLGGGLDARD